MYKPLLAAVLGKQASTTAILLDAGASINTANLKGRTALHAASNAGEQALVKLLLDRKCDVNLQDNLGNTPLHDAIFGYHNKVVDLLVSSATVDLLKQNKRGMNALHWAAYHNNFSAVDRILGKNKDIADVKNNGGFAALHIAAVNNHIQVSSHLLIKGSADVNIRTNREETPLHLAAGKCHYTMVKLLLDHTADVKLQDKGGNTSLHVVLGADMSQQTLLHLLMPMPRVSQIEKVKIGCLLVQSGAKIDVRNTDGKTPIDVCSDLNVRRAIVDCAAQIKPAALASRRPTSASREKMLFSQRRNCVECGIDPAEITYEPCKHKAHCLQCTFYSDACPVCYRTIEKRKVTMAMSSLKHKNHVMYSEN
ncbi:E3 ubiquitin-protein ligase mib1-like [Argopecten irradians]|uniref:E3 ubiquitin-protein ligase mib1-like n=1 Tax=Argopecten irradians TaxID=31199 RepID=UPI00371FA5DA